MNKLSISGIKLFKACRRAYQLKYLYGLVPVKSAEALETGRSYHEKLERYYMDGELPDDFSKESAMVHAYLTYVAPKIKMKSCEEWFEKDGFRGRVDGITEDGVLVEHKTASGDITEEYEFMLQWDEQILMYMWLTDIREMLYTVIKKPTIRQKRNESDEEFYQRILDWYADDTDSKVRVLKVERTEEEIAEFASDLMEMKDEMQSAKHFYRNAGWCRHWGRMCEYASVCLHYDPNENYVEFEKREVVE